MLFAKKSDPQATGRGSRDIYLKKGVELYYRGYTLKEDEKHISIGLQLDDVY
ncbi:hypothetical protein YDYSG_39790 [Paenibacillus tyrfis]|nr:hypothetical protein YDYSG_39790 [Paenibacillus tyrfis]